MQSDLKKSFGIVFLLASLLLAGSGISMISRAAEVIKTASAPSNGILKDSNFFPIAVWLQSPHNAARYKTAGINLYVGLWEGPTEEQLDTLTKAGMPVICEQSSKGLAHKDNPIIAGWMHGDEPDNAQAIPHGKGYGPPILPSEIERGYEQMHAADPTRPILLNLGQGVAWDNYIGRGVRRNHPEDYREYVKGGDIVSFDIYPVVHDNAAIAGKLEYVAKGVERLLDWSEGKKTIWNCIECTHIGNAKAKARPEQIRSEVWMSLIHGSRGIIYFVHQFKPEFREAALLDDPVNLAAVTKINSEITSLAKVLNTPSLDSKAVIEPSTDAIPVAVMLKEFEGASYMFTVDMTSKEATKSFKVAGLPQNGAVEVLGESRTIPVADGRFKDGFKPYEVHLYRFVSAEKH